MNPAARILTTLCATLLGISSIGCNTVGVKAPNFSAPHVSIQNQSDARITVQHWTGRLDYESPTGISDWRMPVEHTMTAGECARCSVGQYTLPTGNTDLVVRLRMDYIDPVTMDPRTEWMELSHPAPYRLAIEQDDEGISIRSLTSGPLLVVPESEQIPGRLDDLPVWNAAGKQIAHSAY